MLGKLAPGDVISLMSCGNRISPLIRASAARKIRSVERRRDGVEG